MSSVWKSLSDWTILSGKYSLRTPWGTPYAARSPYAIRTACERSVAHSIRCTESVRSARGPNTQTLHQRSQKINPFPCAGIEIIPIQRPLRQSTWCWCVWKQLTTYTVPVSITKKSKAEYHFALRHAPENCLQPVSTTNVHKNVNDDLKYGNFVWTPLWRAILSDELMCLLRYWIWAIWHIGNYGIINIEFWRRARSVTRNAIICHFSSEMADLRRLEHEEAEAVSIAALRYYISAYVDRKPCRTSSPATEQAIKRYWRLIPG